MSQAATASMDPASQTAEPRQVLLRLVSLARPYLALILAIVVLSLIFAAGRYGRAYMMKPLMDGVLVPSTMGASVSADSFGLLDSLTQRPKPKQTAETEAGQTSPPQTPRTVDTSTLWASLRQLLWVAVLIVVVTPIALFGRTYLSEFAMGRIHLDLQRKLAAKLLKLPLARHDEAHRGDLLTRLQHDVRAARQVNQLLLQEFIVSLCMIAAGLVSLFYISWQLALISLAVAPPIGGVLLYFGRSIRTRAMHRQVQLAEVTGRLMGILSGIKVIKAFGAEENEASAFNREARRLFRHDMRVARHRALSRSAVEALNSAAGIGVLSVALVFVVRGHFGLSLGDVVWFATALASSYKPVKDLARGWGRLMEHVASGQRLFVLLDEDEEPLDEPDAVELSRVDKSIVFRDVDFSYRDAEGQEIPVLQKFNLDVAAGEVVALVGRTGAGKTSLMDLLLRFREPCSGAIEIDGIDIRQIRRHSLMNQIAIVTQDPFLFDTSILENIRYGRPDADDEAVLEAAHAAHADEFANHLPSGWLTQVGEFGVLLSGGQRQRITIARALLRRPSILIFDEATSSLDAKAEKTVQDAVQSLRGRRTIFLIAHRLSTVRQADRIIVLDRGRLADAGTHEELMRRTGLYREWIELQNTRPDPT